MKRRLAWLVGLAALFLVSSAARTAESTWRLAFQDDFERAEPGDQWTAIAGEMRIVDGALEIRSPGVGRAMPKGSYPADVKVVCTAWTPAGVDRCDLTTILNTDARASSSGYFVGYGSWMDSVNHIQKDSDQDLDKSTDYLIGQNDRRHAIEAVKDGGRIYLNVDGHRVLNAHDPDPCGGEGEDCVAFYTWNSAMRIDNLRIYVKGSVPAPIQASALALPVVAAKDGSLTCVTKQPPAKIAKALGLYNQGRYDEAYEALCNGTPDSLYKAAALAWIVGSVEFTSDAKGTRAILSCLDHLPKSETDTPSARALQRLTRRLAVLSGAISGSTVHYLPRLLRDVRPGHPFYEKAQLYQARVYAWEYMEAIKPRPWERSDAILKPLLARHPNSRIIRMYLGESVPWHNAVNCDVSEAPIWAKELCEAYLRSVSVIEWWAKNRQSVDGSVGGGWGDDVELLRTWAPVAMINEGSHTANETIKRMVDGAWRSDSIRQTGFECFRSDVEHSSEPSSDTQPLMLYLAYGDPEYVERNLVTARLFRDKLMGRNSYGHWHWRSNQISSQGPSLNPKYAVDVPYACRPFKHVLWLAWYSDNPAAVGMLLDWARSWAQDTMRAGNGKPAGVVPASIGFRDDNLSGTSQKWPQPDLGWDYYNWNGSGWMYDIFALAYARSQQDTMLAPIRAALDFKKTAPADTPSWVVDKMTNEAAPRAVEALLLYQTLTGDASFGEITKGGSGTYGGFLESGDRTALLPLIHTLLQSMEGGFEMLTSEVISTDRAGIWCSEDLLRLYCGTPMMWGDSRIPTMSIRWNSPSNKFAAIVTATDPTALSAVLYSFESKPFEMNANAFRLANGVYQLSLGTDADGDWRLDSPSWTREVTISHRGDGFSFALPARQQIVIELRLKRPLPRADGPMPDLAIARKDVIWSRSELNVSVHNIGGRDAGAFTVRVIDAASGRTVATRRVRSLASPSDLRAKVVRLHLPIRYLPRRINVTIDYPGQEITTRNNAVIVEREPH